MYEKCVFMSTENIKNRFHRLMRSEYKQQNQDWYYEIPRSASNGIRIFFSQVEYEWYSVELNIESFFSVEWNMNAFLSNDIWMIFFNWNMNAFLSSEVWMTFCQLEYEWFSVKLNMNEFCQLEYGCFSFGWNMDDFLSTGIFILFCRVKYEWFSVNWNMNAFLSNGIWMISCQLKYGCFFVELAINDFLSCWIWMLFCRVNYESCWQLTSILTLQDHPYRYLFSKCWSWKDRIKSRLSCLKEKKKRKKVFSSAWQYQELHRKSSPTKNR